MYWLKSVGGAISAHCLEWEVFTSQRLKCTVSTGKSIRDMRLVHCLEVVRFSEGLLLEVLLYTQIRTGYGLNSTLQKTNS